MIRFLVQKDFCDSNEDSRLEVFKFGGREKGFVQL